jgi:Zn-dependent protease
MGQTLLAALGAAALLFLALGSWAVLKALRRLRFVEPVVEPIDAAAVPAQVRALLAPSAARLVELGFVEAAAMRTSAQVADGQAQALHSLVFTHPAVAAVAYLSQQLGAQRDRDDTVQFASRLHDGTGLVTRNRMAISGPLPLAHLVTHDCWLPSWAALWQAHRQRMQQMQPDAAQWRRLSGADAVATSADSEAQAFRTRVARGDYVATDGGAWRIGTRFAALTLARAWRWLLPSMKRMPVDAAPGAPTGADATQAWVDAYERDMREQRTSRWSGGAKWLLFAATGTLALASFGLAMDGGTLLALMLVLLFHEMGHFVAMRWAGYADLKVFFLPFLGAAVSGRHERPTLRQELIVLYAGPLPGLVLGVAALFVIGPETPLAPWWRELATLAIVLNALNLLPIHPLDGGKVFELLLLGRWPALAFAARLAGMAALALLASSMDGPGRIALLALALLMSLGIAHLWREARVAGALQQSGQWGGLDRRAALAALFERIAALGYGALPQASRHLMVGALLPGLMRPPLRRAARLGGTLLYGALLAGALLAVVVQVFIGVNSATQMASAAASRAAPFDAAAATQRWADERNGEIEALRQRAAAEAA